MCSSMTNSPRAQHINTYDGLIINYLHDPENSGVSRAYNVGALHAKKNQRQWILLLDQDTTLPDTFLERYGDAIEKNPKP